MKAILVPVELHQLIESTLETAVLVARKFSSYVEGFASSPDLSPFLAADAMGATVIYDVDIEQDRQIVQEARQQFRRSMLAHGLNAGPLIDGGPSFGWREEKTRGELFTGSYARIFDLTVVGRPGARAGQPRMGTLEAALFESGRPILIAPPEAPKHIGRDILIAWNGSTETARTIGLALPFLKSAKRTVVLSVEGSSVPGPSLDQVVGYLELHGIDCEARSVARGTASAGANILFEAEALGCDMVIKGAFTQSRLRQMIFGGATRHIIAETRLPVFMAH
ncbi:universal stress protein [Chelativorans sp. Marseille-P2723]|uniref:universal stress protein n=1 Tax=Chelativorans sp. Marseille-P2723 TaxID=2709133 RepID=UPI00156DC76C|nr:universal stress protein [Chelativorans sp. Marseille-P2723]